MLDSASWGMAASGLAAPDGNRVERQGQHAGHAGPGTCPGEPAASPPPPHDIPYLRGDADNGNTHSVASAASVEIPRAALARLGSCVLVICGRGRSAAQPSACAVALRAREARRGWLHERAGPPLSCGASSLPVPALQPPEKVARGSRPRLLVRIAKGRAPLCLSSEWEAESSASWFLPIDPPGQRQAPRAGRPLVFGLQPGEGPKLGAGGSGLGGSRHPRAQVATPAPPLGPAEMKRRVFVKATFPAGPHRAFWRPGKNLFSESHLPSLLPAR